MRSFQKEFCRNNWNAFIWLVWSNLRGYVSQDVDKSIWSVNIPSVDICDASLTVFFPDNVILCQILNEIRALFWFFGVWGPQKVKNNVFPNTLFMKEGFQ